MRKCKDMLIPFGSFLDHIASPAAIVLPVQELCRICREYDVISVIDGAHAPGQLSLNIESIGADFYAGKMWFPATPHALVHG